MNGRLRRGFERAARDYDRHAGVQREVTSRLLERLDLVRVDPALALDLGAGTGDAAARLQARFPRARVLAADFAPAMLRVARAARDVRLACACDAFRLPLPAHAVDLAFSSSTLQWCEPLDAALAELLRVLRPGGLLLFATYGPDTLRELRAAQEAAGIAGGVNEFHDMHPIGDLLTEQGWADPVLDAEHLEASYASPEALLRELRGVGSRRAAPGAPVSRARFRAMLDAYPRGGDGRVRATYEVIYGHALGPAGRAADGVAAVPLAAVGRPAKD